MGVKRGLSVDGIIYFSDLLESKKEPDWMEFGVQIGKLSGHYEIIDFLTGYKNMDQFLFRTPKWPIGGMYFDGIMRTEHVSRIRPTEYPVQTGATMTDHALVEPAEVTIEIMMTDAKASSYMQNPMLPQGLPGYADHGEGRPFGARLDESPEAAGAAYSDHSGNSPADVSQYVDRGAFRARRRDDAACAALYRSPA